MLPARSGALRCLGLNQSGERCRSKCQYPLCSSHDDMFFSLDTKFQTSINNLTESNTQSHSIEWSKLFNEMNNYVAVVKTTEQLKAVVNVHSLCDSLKASTLAEQQKWVNISNVYNTGTSWRL